MGHKYARPTVARLITRHPAAAEDIASLFDVLSQPRDDVVAEAHEPTAANLTADHSGDTVLGDTVRSFTFVDGPFRSYRRTIRCGPSTPGHVLEEFEYELAIPYLSWLYALPIRHQWRRRPPNDEPFEQPGRAPPDRVGPRASTVLALPAV